MLGGRGGEDIYSGPEKCAKVKRSERFRVVCKDRSDRSLDKVS